MTAFTSQRPDPLQRRLRVLLISAEVEPFARTGGLGDVVGGLSKALAQRGLDVVVVTPRYGVSQVPSEAVWWPEVVSVRIGWGTTEGRVLGVLAIPPFVTAAGGSVRVFLVDHPDLFARAGIYGDAHGVFGDNDVRYTAMSRGALAIAERIWPADSAGPVGPDVLHAHDWHAAPAIISARLTMGASWLRPKRLFTIHNLAFQGVFGSAAVDRLGLPRSAFDDGTIAHDGQLNLLRGAIALADAVSTVSPTYAREIQTPSTGCGLDTLLRAQGEKLTGILNGIDDESFDPRHDPALISRYDSETFALGKGACKRDLVGSLGLDDDDGPLFACVSRLTEQKGFDVLLSVLPALVEHGARLVLIGSGEAPLEAGLVAAAGRFPGRVAARITFDGTLARRVYAAADFFVVPSRYEPCGLTQLYAMRYGAIPIVTAVGGLRDTVEPIHSLFGTGTGFVAPRVDATALLVACADALSLFRDPDALANAIRRCLCRDSSWLAPAEAYERLYAVR